MKKPTVLYLLILLTLSPLLACQGKPIPQGLNLLVVTFDTVRADHFGCYGYATAQTPNVDRLASEGVLFEHCTSPVPITLPAHTSLFTGRYPYSHGVRNNGNYFVPDRETTLAEIFQERGYDTAAFVSAYVLHSLFGLAQGFKRYDDTVSAPSATELIEERKAKDTADVALAWLDQKRDRPFFLWVHFFDPHQAYVPPEEWAKRFPNDLYSGEIAYADSQLGRILERIDRSKTVVLFTGDHGESLGEHGEQTHAFFVYESTLHVPFIMRFPDGRSKGTRDGRAMSLVDAFPTILEYCGIPVPNNLDGRNLMNEADGKDDEKTVYFESIYPSVFDWSPLSGMRNREWKYIESPKPELYHLTEDPTESLNVLDKNLEVASRLRGKLQAIDAFSSLDQPEAQRDLSAEERQTLASLGYVGGVRGGKSDLANREDPKDALPNYVKFMEAGKLKRKGQLDTAEISLRELLSTNPDMHPAEVMLAEVLRDSRQFDQAFELLSKIMKANPEDNSIPYALAVVCNQAEKFDETIRVCNESLKIFPKEAGLLDQLGLAYKMSGDLKKAVEYGRKAIELVGNRPEYLNNLGASYSAANDLKKARETLERAITIRPDFPQGLFNLGVLLMKIKDYPEAEKRFRQAIGLDDKNHDAWLQLNKAVLYQKRSDDALEISKHLLEMKADDPEVQYFMSVAYRQKKSYADAEKSLRDFLSASPKSGFAYVELCESLLGQTPPKIQEAKEAAREAQKNGATIPAEMKKKLGM